jgi:hypothetical protein
LLSEANEKRFEQVITSPCKRAKKKRIDKTDYHFPKPIWSRKKKKKVATPDMGKAIKEEE